MSIQNDEKTDSIFRITASWLLLCESRIYIFSVKKTSHEDKIKRGLNDKPLRNLDRKMESHSQIVACEIITLEIYEEKSCDKVCEFNRMKFKLEFPKQRNVGPK